MLAIVGFSYCAIAIWISLPTPRLEPIILPLPPNGGMLNLHEGVCHPDWPLDEKFCTMDESQIYARLAEIFQDVFDEDSIRVTPELSANDVDGWDSLTHIRLMLTVEKAFKIKLSVPEIGKLENVGDLVMLIKART